VSKADESLDVHLEFQPFPIPTKSFNLMVTACKRTGWRRLDDPCDLLRKLNVGVGTKTIDLVDTARTLKRRAIQANCREELKKLLKAIKSFRHSVGRVAVLLNSTLEFAQRSDKSSATSDTSSASTAPKKLHDWYNSLRQLYSLLWVLDARVKDKFRAIGNIDDFMDVLGLYDISKIKRIVLLDENKYINLEPDLLRHSYKTTRGSTLDDWLRANAPGVHALTQHSAAPPKSSDIPGEQVENASPESPESPESPKSPKPPKSPESPESPRSPMSPGSSTERMLFGD
jgi:hypothetical protein